MLLDICVNVYMDIVQQAINVELVSPTVGMRKVGIALRCLIKDLIKFIVH